MDVVFPDSCKETVFPPAACLVAGLHTVLCHSVLEAGTGCTAGKRSDKWAFVVEGRTGFELLYM